MLKLSQTGSLQNHLYSRKTKGQPNPTIGMGATILCWTDRHAATITEVFKKGKFTYVGVKRDFAKRVDKNGQSEDQEYKFSPNEKAFTKYFRYDGESWQAVYKNEDTGRWKKHDSHGLRIGERLEYYDPSF